MSDIKTTYQKLCAAIAAKNKAAQLLAVSKGRTPEAIMPLLTLGHRVFGENRVQEAQQKWQPLKAQWSDIELHFIGALQTNKIKEALALFDVIETLDRPRLAAALATARDKGARLPRLFIQVNTGNEAQKAGIAADDAPHFIDLCRKDYGLAIDGLMCLPPQNTAPAPHFKMLADLAHSHNIAHLSMGMSGDYTIALDYGADIIRIGTALFE